MSVEPRPEKRYLFSQGDPMATPYDYGFSTANGEFFGSFLQSRKDCLRELCGEVGPDSISEIPETWISEVTKDVRVTGFRGENIYKINLLLARFAVSKRIWNEYGIDLRPVKGATFSKLGPYLEFAQLLVQCAHSGTSQFRYINALLQVNDILCSNSVRSRLTLAERVALRNVLIAEDRVLRSIVDEVYLND